MNDAEILKQLYELKQQIAILQEKVKFSWIYPIVGVGIGALLSIAANYLVFIWNRKKEDRRLRVQYAARLTGTARKYGDAAFEVEEAQMWQAYIVNATILKINHPVTLEMCLKNEREALKAYGLARSEFEQAFTEYLGVGGNKDQKFLDLIVELRKSGLNETVYEAAKTVEEFDKINISELIRLRVIEHHANNPNSLNGILSRISSHLRFKIAP